MCPVEFSFFPYWKGIKEVEIGGEMNEGRGRHLCDSII